MSKIKIAALFVQKNGIYFNDPIIDPWDEERDARLYSGPYPVIAHPPCERWGRYWSGGPMLAGTEKAKKLGDDNGCFETAINSVRKFGGVIEHPEASHAWSNFGLNKPPKCGGWVCADFYGGMTCCIEQGAYGHLSKKSTWLYINKCDPVSLKWGSQREFIKKDVERLSKRQRAATPLEFKKILIRIALTSYDKQ